MFGQYSLQQREEAAEKYNMIPVTVKQSWVWACDKNTFYLVITIDLEGKLNMDCGELLSQRLANFLGLQQSQS